MSQALQRFAPGDPLVLQGEPLLVGWMIESGEVEMRENRNPVRKLAAGERVGEALLLSKQKSTYDVIALEEVRARRLAASEVEVASPVENVSVSVVESADTDYLKPKDFALDTTFSSVPVGVDASAVVMAKGFEALAGAIQQQNELIRKQMSAHESELAIIEQERKVLTGDFLNKMADLGAITPLMQDESINDILINGHKDVFIERYGKLQKVDIQLSGEEEVLQIAHRIAAGINRELNPYRPLLDARLADGSRVNIISPPLAVDGTSISIRKFTKSLITLDDMITAKNMSESLGEFLKVVGKSRLNIVISGGTGSGKTTLLNAVSQFIDHEERVVTIEDAAELKLKHPNLVRLETRPAATRASADMEVNMRDLVKNALRMRPDRIIVGEVRGHEAFDMMQAMNTGHEGSLTTVHANHPRDALSRIENMISMANLNIPAKAVRYQIASALHLIVQISRQRDGHRRITQIAEIVGMEGDTVTMNDLFNFIPKGEDKDGKVVGEFKWAGIMPRFVRRVAYYGELPRLEKALGVKIPLQK